MLGPVAAGNRPPRRDVERAGLGACKERGGLVDSGAVRDDEYRLRRLGESPQGREPRFAGGVVQRALELDRAGEFHRPRRGLGRLPRSRGRRRHDRVRNVSDLRERPTHAQRIVVAPFGQSSVEIFLPGNPRHRLCVSHEENGLHANQMYTHRAMIRTDRAFSEAIEQAVSEAERDTAAELIVVAAARSGSYLDAAGTLGAGGAMLVLLVALFAPTLFPPIAVALDVPLVFALVTWLAHRTPALMRAIVPAARRRRQVERAAAEHFLAESVHGTRGRTGLLVYVSLLEERVALVPDLGIEGRVPGGVWADLRWSETGDPSRPRTLQDLVQGLEQIGAILRLRIPADATDVNESPNAPRIVP